MNWLTKHHILIAYTLYNRYDPWLNNFLENYEFQFGMERMRFNSSIVRHFCIKLRKTTMKDMLTLFESLCIVCISMVPPLIWKKLRNPTHIIFILPLRLSDYRAVQLAIRFRREKSFKIIKREPRSKIH